MESDGPIIVFALYRILRRLPLRMALDANVVCLNVIEPRGIHNVGSRWLARVSASRAMAFFAPDIPFGDGLGLDVVIDGVAAVTEGAGRTLRVRLGIKLSPPVGAGGRIVRAPNLVHDIPLRIQRKVVITDFLEISLFPLSAVNKRDIVLLKGEQGICLSEIRKDYLGMDLGISDDIRHPRFGPARVDFRMATFTSRGARIRSRRLAVQRGRQRNAAHEDDGVHDSLGEHDHYVAV